MTSDSRSRKSWREYESQVYEAFRAKYPQHEILYDQKLPGRHSKVQRQIDVLVKANVADIAILGAFDCKHFSTKVDVKVIDGMVGFMEDLGVHFGGVISTRGFSVGATNRAQAAGIELRLIPFTSPEVVVDEFVPRMDFSDPRNSMYIALL